jgi:alkanesulfonate monooxygenase SsuD/methylene tetrahydromethanopterin reductase-like flavin-dependent oxidoreductase (luciferase family)
VSVQQNIALARGAHNVVSAHGTRQGTVDGAIEAGTMFAGTPDQVFKQIQKHWDYVGGWGHLLIMGQAGFLEHDDTVHGIKMFAREVYPRLKELYPDTTISGANLAAAKPAAVSA